MLREPSAVDERDTRHLKCPVKGFAGRALLLEPHKAVKSPTAPLNLQFNRVHAGDRLHTRYRKTHTGTLCTIKLLSDSLEIGKGGWMPCFFVFFLCLRFKSCFQTPTISHLYLWLKHPPHTHPSESKTCKPLHLTVTQVKQTFPMNSQLLLCSKQAFWLSGMSSSPLMALLFTSGVINVKYNSTSEKKKSNCLK